MCWRTCYNSKNGVEEIIELELQNSEKDEFDNSVKLLRACTKM